MFVSIHKLKYKNLILPILLVSLNFIIKGLFLTSNPLGVDESYSVFHAQLNISLIIDVLTKGNNPPLYEILLHFWINIFGISELSVRMPSLIFSCITLAFIYKIGLNFFNKRIAFFSCFLFIFSNYQIIFAHEARAYALVGMFSSISMFYFLGFITRGFSNVRQFMLYVLINILLIYTHYLGFFVLFVQVMYWITNKDLLLKYWKKLLLFCLLVLVAYLPILSVLVSRFIDSSVNGTWVQEPNGLNAIYDMLRRFTNAPVVCVFAILLILASIVKYFLRINRRNMKLSKATSFIILSFVFPFISMFIISYWIPMFLDRYLMFVTISFYIVLVLSADYLFENIRLKYLVLILLSCLFIFSSKPNLSTKSNEREVVNKIKELKNDNSLVLVCPKYFILNFIYYYNVDAFKDINSENIYENIDNELENDNIYFVNSINEIDYQKYNSIIYLDAGADFIWNENNIVNTLNENYDLENMLDLKGVFKIYMYKSI